MLSSYSLVIRRIAARQRDLSRCLTTGSSLSVNLDHFSSGLEDEKGANQPGMYKIQTYNKISPKGLAEFPSDAYVVEGAEDSDAMPHALLMRSYKLKEEEVPVTCRAIARCGAGTNNIPVDRMTELGIPVFNTPGANANAVKELVLCGLLLGSRKIVDGINHMKDLGARGEAKERVEKDKAMFGGRELTGKKLAVIGLGNIGAATARDAMALGMDVSGYDPGLSVASALKLPNKTELANSIAEAVADADYISLNIPYIKGEEGTHHIIGDTIISSFKEDAVLLNFARGELVDSEELKKWLDKGDGKYVSDFPDDVLWDHKNAIILPHLGASTAEAEENAAAMAAETIKMYLETGNIRHSVNFPETQLPDRPDNSIRFTVVNKNQPGMLARITDCVAKANWNILQQINQSRGAVAYNVLDIEVDSGIPAEFAAIQKEVTLLDGVLSSRAVFASPGVGYARNIDGEYYA